MTAFDRKIVFTFRMLMAWTFLYAASHQVLVTWSVAAFLGHTKTFHDLYAPLTAPSIDPALTFLVSYGHLLIGLSLLTGLAVRLSAPCGIALMLIYWTAHMDWPYIEDSTNFLVDFHIVYATVLVYLVGKNAGHVLGMDGWLANSAAIRRNGLLRWATAQAA